MFQFKNKSKLLFNLWITFIAITGLQFYFVFPALLKPETDIIALLPKSDNSFADESIKLISAEASKEILFLVYAKESLDAIKTGQEFLAQIQSSMAFESVEPMVAEEILKSGLALYAPYRGYILPEKTISLLSTKGLPAGLQQSLSILQSPLSAFYADFLKDDPLFNVPLYLQESSPQSQNQIIQDGYLLLKNENQFYFVINARLKNSPFEKGTHDILMPDIKDAEQKTKNKFPDFQLLKSGLVFFAQHYSVTAQNEISWLGTISLLGSLLFMLIIFRSFKQILLSIFLIGVGVMVALTTTLLVFPKIHLITLTFGTSLIGIAIDYSTHYFSDNLINKNNWTPTACIQRIGDGVAWGAFTTVLAFIAIAINPLPGLHQIAVFSVAGIFGAFFTMILTFPFLLTGKEKRKEPFLFVTKAFDALFLYPPFIAKFKNLFYFLFAITTACLFLVKTDDNIRSLQSPPANLLANEKRAHQLLHKYEPTRFILVKSDSTENLLQKEESIKPLLSQLIKNNVIDRYLAISQFLPSQTQQDKNQQLLRQSITNKEIVYSEDEKNILESTNLSEAYQIASESSKLTPENFYATSFGKKFRNLLHRQTKEPFSLILLQSVKSDQAITEILKDQKDVFYINKTAQISDSLKQIREQIILCTILVYALIYFLLVFKYGFMKSIPIVAVPAFSAMASIVLVSFFQPIHISHILAVIIVLGTGIDYTIFLSESPIQRNATTLAIFLSAITTILSFGLLAFCQTEFLSAFGVIILIGVSISYLFAPLFFVKTTDNRKEDHHLSSGQ